MSETVNVTGRTSKQNALHFGEHTMSDMSIDAVLAKAKEFRASGRDHEAIELLAKAMLNITDARLFFSRGLEFDLTYQPEKAVEDFTRALELDPKNVKYLLNRGCVLSHSLEREGEAVCDFENVLELGPDNIDAHRECCLCLLLLGWPNRAWEHAAAALRLAPCDAVTHFCVGETQMSLRLFDDAIKSFTRAVELDPTQDHYRAALIRASEKEQQTRDNPDDLRPGN